MIVGLCGTKGSGKDTVAEMMFKISGFKKISFADPLKEACSSALGIPIYYFHESDLKDKELDTPIILDIHSIQSLVFEVSKHYKGLINIGILVDKADGVVLKSPRQILQYVGTDLFRDLIDSEIWIKCFEEKIKTMDGHIVCTDARFPNERNLLRKLGATLAFIHRPDVVNQIDTHISENQFHDDYHVHIVNDRPLHLLKQDIELWLTNKLRSIR